jgi:hypothetical protein
MPPMKAMTINAWSAEAYNSTDFDQSITNLANIGANWVVFDVFWFMNKYTDNDMQRRPENYTASDSSLIHAIQKAQQLGMKVSLKPMVDVLDGVWRGQIAPTNWTLWFQNYRNFIDYYADLAQTYNVDLFTVGTELRSSQSYVSQWQQVISGARAHFSGNMTYAANWDSYGTGSIGFWNALDFVGVDAYFPLTNSYDPTVPQLIGAWSYNTAQGWWGTGHNWTNELYLTYMQTGKKIMFTEIGYTSQNGTNTQPFTWNVSPVLDLQEQADCYQAAIEVFKGKNWFMGWFWWTWETNPNAGGPTDKDYTPQNKPAQDILDQYYHDSHDIPDIAVTNLTCQKTAIPEGDSPALNVTLENQGAQTESFNLTVYANTTLIHIETVTLGAGANQTTTFFWNTTGFTRGKYVLNASVLPLPFEIDASDNTLQIEVALTIPGDANGDMKVDIYDAILVANAYSSKPGSPNWNPNSDINGDNVVDIYDAIILANNYGKTST